MDLVAVVPEPSLSKQRYLSDQMAVADKPLNHHL